MAAYRREVDIVAGYFRGYQVDHVDRRKNEAAGALSRLGSQRKPVPPNVFLDVLHNPSVKIPGEEDLVEPVYVGNPGSLKRPPLQFFAGLYGQLDNP